MIRTHRLQLMNSSKRLSGKPRNETEVSQYTALTYTTSRLVADLRAGGTK